MSDYVPRLTVMVGLPGSGKSTYLNFVDEPEFGDTVFVYSTDNYIEDKARELGKTYNECFRDYIDEATKDQNARLEKAIAAGMSVYWDQTNMGAKKRRSILSKFPKTYEKTCYCIAPPTTPEQWAELNRRLQSRPGKNIPMHVVEAMASTYVEPSLDEGFDSIMMIYI